MDQSMQSSPPSRANLSQSCVNKSQIYLPR